jgi:hypothetical protein
MERNQVYHGHADKCAGEVRQCLTKNHTKLISAGNLSTRGMANGHLNNLFEEIELPKDKSL